MPQPDEASPGPPNPPLPQATGRLPHGLRPIIPTGPLPAPAPPLRPPSLPVPAVHIPLIQPPDSMLATGLLPLEPPPPPAPSHAKPVEGRLATGLLPISISYPPSPTGTQRLVGDIPAAPPRDATPRGAIPSAVEPPRRPPPEGDKAAKLGLHTSEASLLPAVRPANQRRSSHTLKLFLLMLFIMVDCFIAFAALLYNYYQQNIEPRLSVHAQVAPILAPPPPLEKPGEELKSALAAAHHQIATLQTQVEELSARQKLADSTLKNLSEPTPKQEPGIPSTQLTLTDGQIIRLQSQVNELRTQQRLADAQMQKLSTQAPTPKAEERDDKLPKELAAAIERINQLQTQVDATAAREAKTTETLREMAEKSPPIDAPAETVSAPTPTKPYAPLPDTHISTVVAVNSEAGAELRLLKERNRLTLYADQALANASAEAMARLWQSIRDPDLAFVKDGAVAEIVRVQHFYGTLRGLPDSYRLPVAELFKDGSVHAEADLKDEQVAKLLLDQAQPPEIRTRAATILSGHKTKAVGEALVEAMRHDPNLLVVKTAQNALQDTFELYEPRLFDAISMQKAWDGWVAEENKK